MKLALALSALLLGGGFCTAAAAGCDNPPLVMIPASEKMSKKEAEKVTEDVKKYMTAVQSYVSCVQAEMKKQVPECSQETEQEFSGCIEKKVQAAGDSTSGIPLKVLLARNNAAVAEASAVTKWFQAKASAEQVGPPAGPTPGEAPAKQVGKRQHH
ncbi:MAG TPA: hypothetical protein VFV10_00410 [Gammaproteobacteria bacterium]|nr:hypothetical protein [Gammaproteobacteria bacterium]